MRIYYRARYSHKYFIRILYGRGPTVATDSMNINQFSSNSMQQAGFLRLQRPQRAYVWNECCFRYSRACTLYRLYLPQNADECRGKTKGKWKGNCVAELFSTIFFSNMNNTVVYTSISIWIFLFCCLGWPSKIDRAWNSSCRQLLSNRIKRNQFTCQRLGEIQQIFQARTRCLYRKHRSSHMIFLKFNYVHLYNKNNWVNFSAAVTVLSE